MNKQQYEKLAAQSLAKAEELFGIPAFAAYYRAHLADFKRYKRLAKEAQ